MQAKLFLIGPLIIICGLIGSGITALWYTYSSNSSLLNVWSAIQLCVYISTQAGIIYKIIKWKNLQIHITKYYTYLNILDIDNLTLPIALFIWGIDLYIKYEEADIYAYYWIWFQIALWLNIIPVLISLLMFCCYVSDIINAYLYMEDD